MRMGKTATGIAPRALHLRDAMKKSHPQSSQVLPPSKASRLAKSNPSAAFLLQHRWSVFIQYLSPGLLTQ
jgi:ribonuclease I